MRTRYDEELHLLGEELQRMGALCEEAIADACKALLTGDGTLRQAAFAADDRIDGMERDIEQICMRLLLRQQPVATDLRFISSALKMISDLERIGDQASDIAELSRHLERAAVPEGELGDMARCAVNMVSESVRAYAEKNAALARTVIDSDDELDGLFSSYKAGLAERLRAGQEDSAALIDLLMVAKYLERIGDHATNVAEWAEYTVTGVHPRSAERRG